PIELLLLVFSKATSNTSAVHDLRKELVNYVATFQYRRIGVIVEREVGNVAFTLAGHDSATRSLVRANAHRGVVEARDVLHVLSVGSCFVQQASFHRRGRNKLRRSLGTIVVDEQRIAG